MKPIQNDNGFKQAHVLGLWGLLAHWDEIHTQPWVQKLIEWEQSERKQRSLDRRIRYSGIKRFKLMADFDWSWPKQIDRVQVEDLFTFRFINEINLATGDPLDWSGFIDASVLKATLGVECPTGHAWARSMHELHWRDEDHRLAFRFGIHNSDFPSPVVKRVFILDYDCVSIGAMDASMALKCLTAYNRVIADQFEASIGPNLRELMFASPDADSGGGE